MSNSFFSLDYKPETMFMQVLHVIAFMVITFSLITIGNILLIYMIAAPVGCGFSPMTICHEGMAMIGLILWVVLFLGIGILLLLEYRGKTYE